MHRALWLLLGLQIRGWVRYLGRSMGTVRGALLVFLGGGVFVVWLSSVWFTQPPTISDQNLRNLGPAFLVLYCVLNVLNSSTEKGIYFSPAEVNFLFPGPFHRRALLVYKIVSTLMVSVVTALVFALVFHRENAWFLATYLGLLLVFGFMQLFTMAVRLLANALGERLYTRGRRLVLGGILVLIGVLVFQVLRSPMGQDPLSLGRQLVESSVWQVVSAPLRVFAEIILAKRFWPDLIQYVALGVLVNAGVLGIVFLLDAHYLESSATTSARIYARMQRMRGRSVAADDRPGVPGRPPRRRYSLPMVPWSGGVGPIFWRQLLMGIRGLGRVLLILGLLALAVVVPVLANMVEREQVMLGQGLIATIVWIAILLTPLVPFDFRGDVDRIALLKTLPIASWRLTLGQLLAPVVIMSVLQGLILLGIAILVPACWPLVLVCLVYVVPFHFLLFGIENVLFLFFPTRQLAHAPGDFQAVGRNVLFLLTKVMTLTVVSIPAMILGFFVYLITGEAMLGVLAGWPVVAVCCAVLVPVIAFAFERFDVSRDTPT